LKKCFVRDFDQNVSNQGGGPIDGAQSATPWRRAGPGTNPSGFAEDLPTPSRRVLVEIAPNDLFNGLLGSPRNTMRAFDDQKPEITYPCLWSYRVIGADEVRLRAVISEVVVGLEHSLTLANESSHGRYRSIALEVLVRDEEHRNAIFHALGKHPDVRFVF
jgi:hypothetical protein